jgi:putative colanic acid biosynthesis acetyltransferase WcaF
MQDWHSDPAANRTVRKYSRGEQLRRIAWSCGNWLIRLSPRPMFGWRRAVLRMFGGTIGKGVHIYPSTRIAMPWNVELGDWCALGEDVYIYSLGRIRIGCKATISYRSHLCAGTHDLNDPMMPLLRSPVCIEDDVWIGTDAFVGPGVTVGRGAVVGARAVVVKDVPPMQIVAGNPARPIGSRGKPSPPRQRAPDHE